MHRVIEPEETLDQAPAFEDTAKRRSREFGLGRSLELGNDGGLGRHVVERELIFPIIVEVAQGLYGVILNILSDIADRSNLLEGQTCSFKTQRLVKGPVDQVSTGRVDNHHPGTALFLHPIMGDAVVILRLRDEEQKCRYKSVNRENE